MLTIASSTSSFWRVAKLSAVSVFAVMETQVEQIQIWTMQAARRFGRQRVKRIRRGRRRITVRRRPPRIRTSRTAGLDELLGGAGDAEWSEGVEQWRQWAIEYDKRQQEESRACEPDLPSTRNSSECEVMGMPSPEYWPPSQSSSPPRGSEGASDWRAWAVGFDQRRLADVWPEWPGIGRETWLRSDGPGEDDAVEDAAAAPPRHAADAPRIVAVMPRTAAGAPRVAAEVPRHAAGPAGSHLGRPGQPALAAPPQFAAAAAQRAASSGSRTAAAAPDD